MNRFLMAVVVGLAACASAAEDGQSDSALAAIDTMKAGVADSVSVTDTITVPAMSSATMPARSPSAAAGTKTTGAAAQTSTKTAPRDTTNIGRDRAIQIDTKDPRRMLPTVDTTKDTTKRRPPN
jgi:hypothetical protein